MHMSLTLIYKKVITRCLKLWVVWTVWKFNRQNREWDRTPRLNVQTMRLLNSRLLETTTMDVRKATQFETGFQNAWHMLECLTYIETTLLAAVDYVARKSTGYQPVETEDKWVNNQSPFLPRERYYTNLDLFMVGYNDLMFDWGQYFTELRRVVKSVEALTQQLVGSDYEMYYSRRLSIATSDIHVVIDAMVEGTLR